jgi:hypothetical protein
MKRVEEIYREILDYCNNNSNQERADKYLRYFKDGPEELCDLLFRGKQEEIGFAVKDTAPRLIIQYATEKMTLPEREKFRKQK